MTTRTTLPMLALAVLLLGGCAFPTNSRSYVGLGESTVTLEALEPGEPMVEATGPSLTGVNRRHWEQRDYVAVNDGVGHWTNITRTAPQYDDSSARNGGAWPTAETCVEMDGDGGTQVLEILATPFVMVGDVILAIPRIADPRERVSPLEGEGYERQRIAAP